MSCGLTVPRDINRQLEKGPETFHPYQPKLYMWHVKGNTIGRKVLTVDETDQAPALPILGCAVCRNTKPSLSDFFFTKHIRIGQGQRKGDRVGRNAPHRLHQELIRQS